MIVSPIGEIIVEFDEVLINYDYESLRKKTRVFHVDERYRIRVPLDFQEMALHSLKCWLKNVAIVSCGIDSGQALALISIDAGEYNLCIGVEDEREGTCCTYVDNGIMIEISKEAKLTSVDFYVAWEKIVDRNIYDNTTRFAADPSVTYENES